MELSSDVLCIYLLSERDRNTTYRYTYNMKNPLQCFTTYRLVIVFSPNLKVGTFFFANNTFYLFIVLCNNKIWRKTCKSREVEISGMGLGWYGYSFDRWNLGSSKRMFSSHMCLILRKIHYTTSNNLVCKIDARTRILIWRDSMTAAQSPILYYNKTAKEEVSFNIIF